MTSCFAASYYLCCLLVSIWFCFIQDHSSGLLISYHVFTGKDLSVHCEGKKSSNLN